MIKLLVIVSILKICYAARILAIAPFPSYSHQIVYRPIWKELAARGHDLVVLTTDPLNDPSLKNYKEIDLSFSHDIMNKHDFQKAVLNTRNILTLTNVFHNTLIDIYQQELAHPEVQQLIHNQTEHFDLVIAEHIITSFFAFKHRFNAPLICVSSMDVIPAIHEVVGNPTHPVIYPNFQLPLIGDLNFFERIITTYYDLFIRYSVEKYIAHETGTMETYFGKGYPAITEIQKSMDLLIINVNRILHQNRPLGPATISIGGGIHFQEGKPLPQDLKEFLDNAENGVIVMSLGTNIKSNELPLETTNMILQVFSELPYKILWKFESEDLPGKSDNVKISKWIPQHDVLKHPNIKVLITQGGLQSFEEAFYSYVPIVGMPFLGDQTINIKNIVLKGCGLSIDYKTMTAAVFKSTVLEVIRNPKYRNRVKELAELSRDEPMTGLEKAIWWTEYVLRHKGAQHLKGPGIDMPLYQWYHLDVLAFTILVLIVISSSIYFIIKKSIKCIFKLLCKKKVKKQ